MEAAGATNPPQAACAGRVPQSQRPGGKKRKVALYVAFVGAGYSGMQNNPGARTIEGELGAAMVRAGAISKENAGDFTKVGWNRAARTDKGVSAAGNVVSLKMMIGFPDIIERINRELPPQIRVLGYTRVTNGFEARKHCDRRRYEYILPAAAFDPSWPSDPSCTAALALDTAAGQNDAADAAQNGNGSTACATPVANSVVGDAATAQDRGGSGVLNEAAAAAEVAGTCDAGQSGEGGGVPSGTATVHGSGEAAAAPDEAGATEEPRRETLGHGAADVQQAEQGGCSAAVEDGAAATSAAVHAEQAQLPAGLTTEAVEGGTDGKGLEAQLVVDGSNPLANGSPDGISCPAAKEPVEGLHVMENGEAAASEQQPEQAALSAAGQGATASSARLRPFTAEDEARLNGVLRAFEGTHCFHNFTLKVGPTDPAVKRYILSCKCDGTMELQGQTWVRMVVLGQSFMLHQIRKMIGTALAIMRGIAPPDAIPLALSPARQLSTPMAPELGLFLDEPVFEAYNDRWGSDREQTVRLSEFQAQTDAFKRDMIYPHIASHDAEHGTNAHFVRNITEACYKFSTWHKAAAPPPAKAAPPQPAKAARGEKQNGKRKAVRATAEREGPAKKVAVVAPAAQQEAIPAYVADAAEWSD